MADNTLVPHLVVAGARKAAAFYGDALGALVVRVMPAEDGERLMHCELAVNGHQLFLCDDFPEFRPDGKSKSPLALGGSSVTVHLVVPDCDAAVAKFAAAGGTVTMPPWDAFWGDRYGRTLDPFGHEWAFSHPLPGAAHAAPGAATTAAEGGATPDCNNVTSA